MINDKDIINIAIQKNPLNTNNQTVINPEFVTMKQDLLFFKDEILRDVRKMEEKLNSKIAEQKASDLQQYNECNKKLDILSAQINIINSRLISNPIIGEKLNSLQTFKSKAEERLFSLSASMNTFQKEYKEYFNNVEKLINDNLKYPGIIGKNSRFVNYRRFIDYILKCNEINLK